MAVLNRDRIQNAADFAKDALDSGLAIAGDKARSYASLGVRELERARGRLPESFQRPSLTMVLTALGAGVVLGAILGATAPKAIDNISSSGKDAIRRRRLHLIH